jgi:hypothetical protein
MAIPSPRHRQSFKTALAPCLSIWWFAYHPIHILLLYKMPMQSHQIPLNLASFLCSYSSIPYSRAVISIHTPIQSHKTPKQNTIQVSW